jgi:hypothetical protein
MSRLLWSALKLVLACCRLQQEKVKKTASHLPVPLVVSAQDFGGSVEAAIVTGLASSPPRLLIPSLIARMHHRADLYTTQTRALDCRLSLSHGGERDSAACCVQDVEHHG